MNKFKISIHPEKNSFSNVDFLPMPKIINNFVKGKHRNLEIIGKFKCGKLKFSEILKIVSDHWNSLKTMHIENMEDSNEIFIWSFDDILFETLYLTKLTLTKCTMNHFEKLQYAQFEFLKSLKLIRTGNKSAISNFLLTCPVLEELTIESFNKNEMIDFLYLFPFQLKKLKLYLRQKLIIDEEILTFLLLQFESLKEITISMGISQNLIENILNEGNFEKLEIGLSPFIENLKLEGRKENIKELILKGNILNFENLKTIFKQQSGIKTIRFPDWSLENNEIIFKHVVSLKTYLQNLENIFIQNEKKSFEDIEI
ncbi:hypothetical protein PVAND_016459 [Polypedilum vanderplanki]|uniref:Uncharacterized protein n=1 Tax=Polypedilum vanderplanki TaxID=319348 RepID=A0A9J6BFW0_POLVA|nr:hypothetical protein PVAND_016459 [Polypedilum vanderplanki]